MCRRDVDMPPPEASSAATNKRRRDARVYILARGEFAGIWVEQSDDKHVYSFRGLLQYAQLPENNRVPVTGGPTTRAQWTAGNDGFLDRHWGETPGVVALAGGRNYFTRDAAVHGLMRYAKREAVERFVEETARFGEETAGGQSEDTWSEERKKFELELIAGRLSRMYPSGDAAGSAAKRPALAQTVTTLAGATGTTAALERPGTVNQFESATNPAALGIVNTMLTYVVGYFVGDSPEAKADRRVLTSRLHAMAKPKIESFMILLRGMLFPSKRAVDELAVASKPVAEVLGSSLPSGCFLLRAHELEDDEEKRRWLDVIQTSSQGDSHATATLSLRFIFTEFMKDKMDRRFVMEYFHARFPEGVGELWFMMNLDHAGVCAGSYWKNSWDVRYDNVPESRKLVRDHILSWVRDVFLPDLDEPFEFPAEFGYPAATITLKRRLFLPDMKAVFEIVDHADQKTPTDNPCNTADRRLTPLVNGVLSTYDGSLNLGDGDYGTAANIGILGGNYATKSRVERAASLLATKMYSLYFNSAASRVGFKIPVVSIHRYSSAGGKLAFDLAERATFVEGSHAKTTTVDGSAFASVSKVYASVFIETSANDTTGGAASLEAAFVQKLCCGGCTGLCKGRGTDACFGPVAHRTRRDLHQAFGDFARRRRAHERYLSGKYVKVNGRREPVKVKYETKTAGKRHVARIQGLGQMNDRLLKKAQAVDEEDADADTSSAGRRTRGRGTRPGACRASRAHD
ncbi:hypothetical protein JL720_13452 [Aureococcus anophagefferens]|nr:hypothetical protein JL720_13452 [Aureococcus anophagefferens]